MSIVVKTFKEKHIQAVREFNERILGGDAESVFPDYPISKWLPFRKSASLFEEHFLVLEEKNVRGAYILKTQDFLIEKEAMKIGNLRNMISEGIVDSKYFVVGGLILRNALNREPMLYCLGMGDYDQPVVKMLHGLNWSMISSFFYFKVLHPMKFFRGVEYLRRNPFLRIGMDFLAYSGLGWAAVQSLQLFRWPVHRLSDNLAVEEVKDFSSWADEIWNRAKHHYAMVGVRDSSALNILYPNGSRNFRRIKVLRQGEVIGWAVAMNSKMKGHKQFGDMQVGSIVDCLASPGNEHLVISMATRYLENEGADIIVTNQLHRSWCSAFVSNGFIRGPSNFIFAASPQLAEKLRPFKDKVFRIHITRGDGDGPIHL